ncbi:MAG: rhamnogalacturonan acetylesterase [Paludibacteraceae bacterium]|nr:rhamnogalacturonan acetylesterase [Paludibacteraceae bacterium]
MYRHFLTVVLCSLFLVPVFGAKRKVHTIGDSTMSEYKPAATPKRGWGMYLQAFFNADSIEVNNRGKSGASTRTFYETDNLWPSVKQQMKAGDYLIIQFAHNDEKCKGEDVYVQNAKLRAEGKDTLTDMRGTEPNTTYKEYLRKFIDEARAMGVKPILMSPICRAYFKDGRINSEGRHKLTVQSDDGQSTKDKDYVRCMREVAEETGVPFLDMTAKSQEMYENAGQETCMTRYFNCGDKTHTGQEGGMVNANLAYLLIKNCPDLKELHHLVALPSLEAYSSYIRAIEDKGKREAFAAKGKQFTKELKNGKWKMENVETAKGGIVPKGGLWPAGEIDEVANRYIEYTIPAEKKKGMVIETITLPVYAKGGDGMNLHINYGFGDSFREVTTIYENTALPKNKELIVKLNQPILVPAGEKLHIRVLPWYDSNGKPQKGKYLVLGTLQITGKQLQ